MNVGCRLSIITTFLHRLKSPWIVAVVLVAIAAVILLADTLEDTLIETGFIGVPFAAFSSALANVVRYVTLTVSSWGYVGIFFLMLLESSSLPIPSEIILPFSGYLVSLGKLNFWIVITVSTAAALMGSLVDYAIGIKGMEAILNSKTGKLLVSISRFETAKRWFERHPLITVLVSRLIPGFRTLASFPAGAVRMPLKEFVTYTLAGCLAWNAVLTYLGVLIGSNWTQIAGASRYIIVGFSLALMIGLIAYLRLRRNSARYSRYTSS